MLQAIETHRKGYRFRSRLEARWSVFFDELGEPYEYEKEGYNLNGINYLPDFWLPRLQCWVEIKGEAPTDEEEQKAFILADIGAHPVVMCSGSIGVDRMNFSELYYEWRTSHKIKVYTGYHDPLRFPVCAKAFWYFGNSRNECHLEDFLLQHFPREDVPRYDGSREAVFKYIELDRTYFRNKYGEEHKRWRYGVTGKDVGWKFNDGLSLDFLDTYIDETTRNAYLAARSARFEYGEHGR